MKNQSIILTPSVLTEEIPTNGIFGIQFNYEKSPTDVEIEVCLAF